MKYPNTNILIGIRRHTPNNLSLALTTNHYGI